MMLSLPLAVLDLVMGSPAATTSGQNFVKQTVRLSGVATAVVTAFGPSSAALAAMVGNGTIVDKLATDLSLAGYPRNGAFVLAPAASTPVTVDLTATAAAAPASAGDTFFRSVKEMILVNLGSADVALSPAAANPFNGPLSGTAPVFTVPANASVRFHSPAGWPVTQTARALKFDPGASAALLAVCVGGT